MRYEFSRLAGFVSLWILEKAIDETKLALRNLILLHFPAMHFKCVIFLLMFAGGIGYCKYLAHKHTHECTQPRTVTRYTHALNRAHIKMLSELFKIFNCVLLLLMFCSVCSSQVQVWFTNSVTLQKGKTWRATNRIIVVLNFNLANFFSIKTELLDDYNIIAQLNHLVYMQSNNFIMKFEIINARRR